MYIGKRSKTKMDLSVKMYADEVEVCGITFVGICDYLLGKFNVQTVFQIK